MKPIETTPFEVAARFLGLAEVPGEKDNPLIQYCFTLCGMSPETHDEVPNCSAFMQLPFFVLGLARSCSARARSWLRLGLSIPLSLAEPGFDVLVLKRGTGPQPGPEVIDAPGHVTLFAGWKGDLVLGLGGNQGNRVSVAAYDPKDVLEVRRVTEMA